MRRGLTTLIAVASLTFTSVTAHGGTDPTDKCTGSKAKVAGKKAADLLKAFGKNLAKNPDSKLAANLSKAQSKFTKGFTKADSKGSCLTTGDAGTVEALVDAAVAELVSDLNPPPPTTTTGATTTSTLGTTTTTTLPSPGVELQGALTPTLGRFNYNLTLGLPGADAACNTNFPGTHACTYTELQTAEAAGDLVGLQDIGSNTVTSFWVIDPAAPALQQCVDDALGGSGLNWEYGTAHTPSRGRRVPLTNGTGALGSLQTSVQCNIAGTSWVGCCL